MNETGPWNGPQPPDNSFRGNAGKTLASDLQRHAGCGPPAGQKHKSAANTSGRAFPEPLALPWTGRSRPKRRSSACARTFLPQEGLRQKTDLSSVASWLESYSENDCRERLRQPFFHMHDFRSAANNRYFKAFAWETLAK